MKQVLQRLQKPEFRAACPGTRVLLAPATRDAAAMPVFPQPPMTPPSASEAAGITWLPNPATFRLNEVSPQPQPHGGVLTCCIGGLHRTLTQQSWLTSNRSTKSLHEGFKHCRSPNPCPMSVFSRVGWRRWCSAW